MTREGYDLTTFADECIQAALELDRLRDPALDCAVTVFLETAYLALIEHHRSEDSWPPSQH